MADKPRAQTKPEPGERWPQLDVSDDGTLIATWPRFLMRFLLADGRTIDVSTDTDNSDLRGAIVAHTGQNIVGNTILPQP